MNRMYIYSDIPILLDILYGCSDVESTNDLKMEQLPTLIVERRISDSLY